MSKKVVSLLISSVLIIGTLSGCGQSNAEISTLNQLSPINSDENTKESDSANLSYQESQDLVYAQVSDRSLLDMGSLDKLDRDMLNMTYEYMEDVNKQLIGDVDKQETDEYVIDECFTNYLLAFFEHTPFYWQRSKMVINGIDSESRSIVVDVTYKTIPFKKLVKKDSYIVKGEPNYLKKMETRFNRYIAILDTKIRAKEYSNDVNADDEVRKLIKNFEEHYGKIKDIYESQENKTLTEEIIEKQNQTTYKGLINTGNKKTKGEIVVRYVLAPKIILGLTDSIYCKHMYILDYKIEKNPTEGKKTLVSKDYDVISDKVYALLHSYFNCIDTNDFNGLYKLTDNFKTLDKYYNDLFSTTYNKHDNFTLSLFEIQGTHIECGVTVSSKSRAKGSNITYPLYTDKYYIEIDLVDDRLKITEMDLISRTIEGEPDIKAKEVDLSGFDSTIALSNEDREEIQEKITKFSALQLTDGDYTKSEEYSKYVDISMDEEDLKKLNKTVLSMTGQEKAVWFNGFRQGNENYASANCTEQFKKDGRITSADVEYTFIKVGKEWKILGYSISGKTILGNGDISTSNALCYVTPNNVELFNKQIAGEPNKQKGDTSEIAQSYTYDEYTPGEDISDEDNEEDEESEDEKSEDGKSDNKKSNKNIDKKKSNKEDSEKSKKK